MKPREPAGYHRGFMARIIPLTPTVDLSTRRGTIRLRSTLLHASKYTFTVDMYSHLRESHPDTHVGWWQFPLPEGDQVTTIGIDLTTIGPGSLWRQAADGRREPAVVSW